jgi:hypothetical protein
VPPTPEVGKHGKPEAGAPTHGGGGNKNKNKKKNKAGGNNQPLVGAPTVAVAAVVAGGGRGPRGDNKCPRQVSSSDNGGARCPVHNSMRHSAGKSRSLRNSTASN